MILFWQKVNVFRLEKSCIFVYNIYNIYVVQMQYYYKLNNDFKNRCFQYIG